jgi:DNA polymerase-3 subunit alpha
LVAVIDQAIPLAQSIAKDKISGQGSLFDMLEEDEKNGCDSLTFPDIPEFHEKEMLENEKELLGFYISGHPLGEYSETIEAYTTHSLPEAMGLTNDTGVIVGGIITSMRRMRSQSGNDFAILQIEDVDGTMECMVFKEVYNECKELLKETEPFLFFALVNVKEENSVPQLIAQKVVPMSEVKEKFTFELHVRLHEGSAKKEMLDQVRSICQAHPGKTIFILCLTCSNGEIIFVEANKKMKIAVTEQLVKELTEAVGENRLLYKADLTVPKPKARPWENRRPPEN